MEQYESGRQEAREAITMVEKEISLGLSETEYGILDSLCSGHGISVGQLFKRFSKDLIGRPYVPYYGFHDWTEEAGSAKEWFVHHCGFGGFPEESLLGHLFTYRQDIGLFLQLTDLIESGAEKEEVAEYLERHGTEELEEAIGEAEEAAQHMETEYDENYRWWGKDGLCLEYLEDMREHMTEMWAKGHPEADMRKEIEAVREWYEKEEGQEYGQKDRVWEAGMGGRHVRLRLTEEDYDLLGRLFWEYGVAAGQVFGRLARDLVDARQAGLSQHGPEADGAGRAGEWFASCRFGRFPEESLVNYLVAYIPNADEFVGMSGFAGYIDTAPDKAMEEISIKGIEEWEAEHPDANVRAELLAVKEWQEEEERKLWPGWQKKSLWTLCPKENEGDSVYAKGKESNWKEKISPV